MGNVIIVFIKSIKLLQGEIGGSWRWNVTSLFSVSCHIFMDFDVASFVWNNILIFNRLLLVAENKIKYVQIRVFFVKIKWFLYIWNNYAIFCINRHIFSSSFQAFFVATNDSVRLCISHYSIYRIPVFTCRECCFISCLCQQLRLFTTLWVSASLPARYSILNTS